MRTITLVGAGGKMGCRIADNLLPSEFKLHCLEVSERGLANLEKRGIGVVEAATAVPTSDVVILAVPDVAMGTVSSEIVPLMRSGALLMTLDPAAPLDGKVFPRDDISIVISHPCHPSIFNWEPSEDGFRDFYGGISAKQSAVVSLLQGAESDYDFGVEVTRAIYGPVSDVHRLSLEQMAILEPALVETLAQSCMEIVHEGYEHVVKLGVPEAAVRDFVLGHLRIQIAVLFNEVEGTFSDAAYKISKRARPLIFKEGWQRIFEMDDIRDQVRDITS